jgi:uncharacterized protein YhaN
MLILELAVQAVRGFSPAARVALKTGYLGLKSPTELPSPLAGLFMSLCYPDGRGADAAFLAPGAKAGRAGFSIVGNDQTTWRLVRDLGGAGALHKLNKQTNAFESVSTDSAEMAQVLRSTVGLPPKPTFEQLFTFSAAQAPTKRPKHAKVPPNMATKTQARLNSAFDQFGDLGAAPDDALARIATLEAELVAAKEAAEIQFRMDGVQGEVFKYEQKFTAYEALREKLEAARAELATAPTPQNLGLPDDIVARVRRFAEDKKRFSAAMFKLNEEREAARVGTTTYVAPIYKDQRFVGAVVGGLALLVVTAVFLEGGARDVALLSVLAFSFAGLLALRYIEELQHASRETAKSDVFEVREKKLKDEYELASSMVQVALDKVEAATADEFFTAMAKGDELRPAMAELELKWADYESDPETVQWPALILQLKNEQESLNQKLLDMSGGYVRDSREIEREIAKLRESMAPPEEPPQEFKAVPTGPSETFDDPTPGLMELASDLFATDVPTLWSVMRDRTAQYLTALTDRRYHGLDVDKDGRATVQAPGRAIPAGELPGRDLDLMWVAMRLTLIEKYSAQTKIPVIIEDAFAGLIDGPKLTLLGRMLKHLGTLTQVLHVSGNGQNVAAADVVLAI